MKRNAFVGRWRITDMENWDEDYRDLVVPAFIEFSRNGQGAFQFGTVEGWLDCRFGERDGLPLAEFSWDGQNDNDPGCGRGWVVLRAGCLEGRIFIHCGDDSSFEARPEKRPESRRRAGR